MFSAVIPPLQNSACPVISKLTLSFSKSKPVEAAVHCLKFPGRNSIIDYTCCGGGVCLDGWFWLGTFHFFHCVSRCHHFLSCDENCPQFCFWIRRHNEFNDLVKNKKGAVPSGHGIVFKKENLIPWSTASFAFIVKTWLRMCKENHVAGAIENSIGRVCSTLIKYLIDCLVDAFRCGGLLGFNGT